MELICPECRGNLVMIDGERARCAVHGGEFRILFNRTPLPSALDGEPIEAPAWAPATNPHSFPAAPPPSAEPNPGNPSVWIRPAASPASPLQPPPQPAARPGSIPPPLPPSLSTPKVAAPLNEVAATSGAVSTPRAFCASHPTEPAMAICISCNRPICVRCAVVAESGVSQCVLCSMDDRSLVPKAPQTYVAQGTRCAAHPNVEATRFCNVCAAPLCPTCDFEFPGNIHLCPTCATQPQEGMTPRRRKLMTRSYILGVVSFLSLFIDLVIAFSVGPRRDTAINVLDIVLSNISLWGALIGVGLGISARDKRLSNPGSVTGAIVLNAIMVGIMLLLTIMSMKQS